MDGWTCTAGRVSCSWQLTITSSSSSASSELQLVLDASCLLELEPVELYPSVYLYRIDEI